MATAPPPLQVVRMVEVSDNGFADLQRRFDAGERNVCSGRKDGTNRPLVRDEATRQIFDAETGARVLSFSDTRAHVAELVAEGGGAAPTYPTRWGAESFAAKTDGFTDFVKWIYPRCRDCRGGKRKPIAGIYRNPTTNATRVARIAPEDTLPPPPVV